MSNSDEKIGFFESITGFVTAPSQTVDLLFSEKHPPYIFRTFLALLITVFGPMVLHLYYYRFILYRPEAIFTLIFVITFTLLIFVLIETLFLGIVGVGATVEQTLAAAVYSLAPWILVTWLIYLFNYMSSGTLSLVSVLLIGDVPVNDHFLRIIPLAILIGQLITLVVFVNAIRSIGSTHIFTASILGILSVIPFYLALVIALFVAETASPGTISLFMKILFSPDSILYFQ